MTAEACWLCSADTENRGVDLTGGAAVCAGQRGAPPSLRYFHIGGQRRLRFGDGAPALGESFTLALWVRRGEDAAVSPDDVDLILHGTDNSAWFAVLRDGNRAAVVHHKHGALTSDFVVNDHNFSWFAVRGDSQQTELLGGHDSLKPLGAGGWSIAGSKLRVAGWSKRTYDLASVHLWDSCLSDEELWGIFAQAAPFHGVKPKTPDPVEPLAAVPPLASKPQLRGRVVDCHGGGLFGVTLSRPSTASTACTDGDGLFELDLEEDEEGEGLGSLDGVVLSFAREGYAPCQVEVEGLAVGDVQMVELSHTATLSSADGGTVVDPSSGASVKIPPGSLTYPDGSPFNGTAHMSLAVVDATSEASLAGMPGDFTAHGLDGADQQLQSMGAIFVGVTDEYGRDLHAKGGGGMELSLQSSASLNLEEVQDVPSVYAFDVDTGKWQQMASPLQVDGKALPAPGAAVGGEEALKKKKGKKKQPQVEEEGEEEDDDDDEEEPWGKRKKKYAKKKGFFRKKKEKVWKAEDFGALLTGGKRREFVMTGIERPGWYNADVPYRPFLVTGELGKEGAGAVVWCVGKTYPGRSRANADELGGFGVVAQQQAEVLVRVAYPPSEGWAQGAEELIATDAEAAGSPCIVEFGPYRTDPGPIGRMRELGRLFRAQGKAKASLSTSGTSSGPAP